jgi:CRISPR/Cas system CMR-associated protein Cmr5 small subunit
MIEGWFKIETYAEEIRKYYEVQKSIKQQYAEFALKKVKELKTYLSDVKFTGTPADEVIFRAAQSAIESLKDISSFQSLTNDEQKVINEVIEHINTFLISKDLKSVIATLDQLERVLEMWKK